MTKPMIRRWDDYCRVVDIGHVEVSQSISLDTKKPEKPTINWSCIGSVGIKEAKKFVDEMERAIILAKILSCKGIPWEHPPRDAKNLKVEGLIGDNSASVTVLAMTLWLPPRPEPVKG